MKNNLLFAEEILPKIIKRKNQNFQTAVVSTNLIKHQILNAEEKARYILQKANSDAEEIINKAEAKAEKIRAEAYEAGRNEAENESLENLLAIKEERLKVLSTIEKDVLRLAIKVAEKIIGKEISQNERVRGEIVLNALRAARQKEMLTVRVNSQDLPIVEKLREQIGSINHQQNIDFIADQAVAEGGCIIESPAGTIDARIETQLRILKAVLLAKSEGRRQQQ